jgi:hypothetical protein
VNKRKIARFIKAISLAFLDVLTCVVEQQALWFHFRSGASGGTIAPTSVRKADARK